MKTKVLILEKSVVNSKYHHWDFWRYSKGQLIKNAVLNYCSWLSEYEIDHIKEFEHTYHIHIYQD